MTIGHSTYYAEATGTYRILRSEVDDRWDSGALVPFCVQWIREESVGDDWQPVETHASLADAKRTAERRLT